VVITIAASLASLFVLFIIIADQLVPAITLIWFGGDPYTRDSKDEKFR
jgi:hypothetical protein